MVKELTTKEFDEATKDGLVLIDLFATWCGPCRMLSPIVDEVSEEVPGLKVFKVDVDESPEIAERYNVASIPTLLVLENGDLKNVSVGYVPKQKILDLLK
jgi:thioredoxin 1